MHVIVIAAYCVIAFGIIWFLNRKDLKDPLFSDSYPYASFRSTEVHEAGHTLTAWACTKVSEVSKVEVFKSRAGLTTLSIYGRDTNDGRWCDLVITLAGMAAELQIYGKLRSHQIAADLKLAFANAYKLEKNGDYDAPWNITLPPKGLPKHKRFSTLSYHQRRIMEQAYAMSHHLLFLHKEKFHKMIQALIKKPTLFCSQIENTLGDRYLIKKLSRYSLFVLPQQN